ncbi:MULTISPECIES: hypothetical protein [Chitinophagaceae]|uniref:hypothetical protein n=1 Tax=Chitinophagaceae TaxID=563835 RepID=UPI000F4F5B1D|nr:MULTISPECIES: hypothetical protein [Chitinophagaceae]RPD44405.1 hypothetical protein DRJ53_16950 [Paracnuella aquatica]
MILSLLLYIFLAYMLYRLVFGLIVPIVRTTRQVKKSFRHMQEQMAAHQGAADPGRQYNQQKASVHSTARGDDEDYIEFEEVK